jgi:hypothetical protein
MLGVENIRKISDLSTRGQSFLIRREIKSSIPVNIIVKKHSSKLKKEFK